MIKSVEFKNLRNLNGIYNFDNRLMEEIIDIFGKSINLIEDFIKILKVIFATK